MKKKHFKFTILCSLFLLISCSEKDDTTYQNLGYNSKELSAPTGVKITKSTSEYIIISWDKVKNATEYEVYHSNSAGGNYTLLKSSITSNTYSCLPDIGDNYYKVKALDYYYRKSELSNYVKYTRNSTGSDNDDDDDDGDEGDNTTKPSAPTGVKAENYGNNYIPEIRISWNSVSNATSYKIYRSTSAYGTYNQIGTATSSCKYSDYNPASGYNYYKVKAVNKAGESSYSNYAYYNYDTSSSLVPATPSVSVSGSKYSISLSWTCQTGSSYGTAKSYEVYKRNPETGEFKIVTTTTSKSYTDREPHPGINRYAVVAVNDAGKSSLGYGYSDEISLSRPSSFSASKSGSYINFSWSKVSGATGYQIFSSSSASGSYYILEDIKGESTTSKKVYYPASSGTTYFKIRAYWSTSYGGSPVYSDYSSYKSVSF